jgi:hypothetical protein
MKKKLNVIFSSHLSDEENTTYKEHIKETIGVESNIVCYPNFNKYSLPQIYNKAIDHHHRYSPYFVFIHNDLVFKTKDWGKILLRKFNIGRHGIIGVAGTTYLAESGVWWEDKKSMCGTVEHTDSVNVWVSKYGQSFVGIKDVVVVDGLFIAVNVDDIIHRFDEDFQGFHMYDISFCVPNYLDGIDIGVINDIRILHKSVGMTNHDWEKSRKIFIDKYKEYLPIKIQ